MLSTKQLVVFMVPWWYQGYAKGKIYLDYSLLHTYINLLRSRLFKLRLKRATYFQIVFLKRVKFLQRGLPSYLNQNFQTQN